MTSDYFDGEADVDLWWQHLRGIVSTVTDLDRPRIAVTVFINDAGWGAFMMAEDDDGNVASVAHKPTLYAFLADYLARGLEEEMRR